MSLSSSMSDFAPRVSLLTKLKKLRRAYSFTVAAKYSLLLASVTLAVIVTLAWPAEVVSLGLFQRAGLLLIALVVAVMAAALRAPSLAAVARRVDREFGLADRTQTALEHVGEADEMALLLTADAERRLPSTWTGTRLFDYRREAQVAVLVFVMPVALGLVTRSVIDIAMPDRGSSVGGSQTVVTTDSLDTDRQPEGALRTPATPTEAMPADDDQAGADRAVPPRAVGVESATGPSGGRSAEQAPGADESPLGVEATASVGSASDGEASSSDGVGGSGSAGASSSGTSARAIAAQFEGVAAPGTGPAASRGAAPDARSGGQSAADSPDTVESMASDPRRASSYPELWNRAQAVPLAERIPAGLRRYIRDYFTAVGPPPQ